MKTACEQCDCELADTDVYICSFECTFCVDCTEAMQHCCPNCGGELVRRPTRPGTPAPSPDSAR